MKLLSLLTYLLTMPTAGLSEQIGERLARMEGFGLIVFYWLFIISMILGLALPLAAFSAGSPWLLLLGLMALRTLGYLLKVGDRLISRYFFPENSPQK